jgi:hypothetical protein
MMGLVAPNRICGSSRKRSSPVIIGAGAKVIWVLPNVMEGYLRDLGRLLKQDIDGAREQLRRLLGTITLNPNDGALVAIVQGNIAGILPVGNLSAGRGIRELANWPPVPFVATA